MSHSKKALILYGRVQGFTIKFSAVHAFVRTIWEVGYSPPSIELRIHITKKFNTVT